jgi:hypothetical protein
MAIGIIVGMTITVGIKIIEIIKITSGQTVVETCDTDKQTW